MKYGVHVSKMSQNIVLKALFTSMKFAFSKKYISMPQYYQMEGKDLRNNNSKIFSFLSKSTNLSPKLSSELTL